MTQDTGVLRGGCCCGAVRYETSAQVFHKTICHCATCRRASGGVSVGWFSVAQPDYRLTAGAPAVFHSSPGVTRTFCSACGTQLSYQHMGSPDEIDITICSLDDPASCVPDDHTFTFYRLGWDRTADGKPEFLHTRADG